MHLLLFFVYDLTRAYFLLFFYCINKHVGLQGHWLVLFRRYIRIVKFTKVKVLVYIYIGQYYCLECVLQR